jgi:cell division protein FtsQ
MIATPHLSPAVEARLGALQAMAARVRGMKAQGWMKGVAAAALLGAAGFMWYDRAPVVAQLQEFIARATDAQVENVMVEGALYTPKDDLLKALDIQKGQPLVGFNTSAARARLEKLPWVRLAAVEKQLPHGIRVVVYEHTPLARVKADDGQVWVVNKDGNKVVVDTDNRFAALPLLDGKGATEAAAKLFAVLAEWPNLTAQLKDADYVGERRWDLHFVSGVTVQLPEDNPSRALNVLADLEKARHVLTLNAGEVDLRLSDRVVLRLPDNVGATPVTNQPAKQG